MIISLHAEFLQTLGSFTAADPWSGNGPVQFCIEDYVMVAAWNPDDPLPPNSLRAKLLDHRFAIRPEAGGEAHFLPETLVNLWRNGKVQANELPRLLAGLQPCLQKNSDYYESSSTFVRRWGNRLIGGFAAVGLLYWLGQILLSRDYSSLKDWAALALFPSIICVPIELVYLRQVRRRAAQKRWLLEHVAASPSFTEPA